MTPLREPTPFDITASDRVLIKGLMKAGLSLSQVAQTFKVSAGDLDISLWRSLGRRN